MAGAERSVSCRGLFKRFCTVQPNIYNPYCHIFQPNVEVYKIDNRHKYHLRRLTANLTVY